MTRLTGIMGREKTDREGAMSTGDEVALTFFNLEQHVGRQIAVTRWIDISQDEAVRFAAVTQDPDPMHTDPQWAAACSPFGATVLAGMHLLSLLPFLTRGNGVSIGGVRLVMNYGFERIRFVSPVPVGRAFRNHVQLVSVRRRDDGRATIVTRNSFEVSGADRPALVADWVNLLWPEIGQGPERG